MNTRTQIILCLLGMAVLAAGSASAAPVWGEIFSLRQPDGALVDVRIWGDEFYQTVESVDGYTLVRDPVTEEICYAVLSQDGSDLASTGIPVDSPAKNGLNMEPHLRITPESRQAKVTEARLRRPLPARDGNGAKGTSPWLGNTVGIVAIIDFPNLAGTITPAEVEAYCNQSGYSGGGNMGSVHDFYHDISGGALNYTLFVPGEYYTALYDKEYYDDNNDLDGVKARELVYEALAALDAAGMDFSQYDSNGDSLVDAVNLFYAGTTSSGWSRGLWPHSGVLFPPFQVDGVMVGKYQMTYMGSELRIGTFCHENGHLLCGWPDLYDYGYESEGLGYHCLMAGGNHRNGGRNPVAPCAYLKDVSSWTTTIPLTGAGQVGLSLAAGSNVIYKYENPANAKEYYLIENRQLAGRDLYKPDHGLEILHVDRDGDNDREDMTPERHYRVTLVQADGQWDLERNVNSGDDTDLWGAPDFTACGPTSDPDTAWWSGQPSYLYIANISAPGPVVTFDYRGAGSPLEDTDDDGMSDWDETRDLDPTTPGIQNPFDPFVADSTGDSGSDEPDGVLDGLNDYDGDGGANAAEFAMGSNPLDPSQALPATSLAGVAAMAALIALRTTRRAR